MHSLVDQLYETIRCLSVFLICPTIALWLVAIFTGSFGPIWWVKITLVCGFLSGLLTGIVSWGLGTYSLPVGLLYGLAFGVGFNVLFGPISVVKKKRRQEAWDQLNDLYWGHNWYWKNKK